MEVFVGTILTFGFNFAPSQWQLCNGQTLNVSQNQALFALIGTNFGGNGTTTFQLPNLQSRSPLGFGQGAGLSNYALGQASGTEQVSILISNMPQHTHVATFTPSGGGSAPQVTITGTSSGTATGALSATNNILAGLGKQSSPEIWSSSAATPVPIGGVTVTGGGGGGGTVSNAMTGGNLPLGVMNPYLALNFSIALFGIFPSRN